MPLIHFAFGSQHRRGDIPGQIDAFVENILLPKKVRAFVCPEFHPIINNPNAKMAVPDSARATGDGGITFDKWVDSPPVGLLPNDVWMVSFVDVPFKKLPRWSPAAHYGHLGIAFTDEFRRRHGVRRVSYYQYPNLARDPLVIQLHNAVAAQDKAKMDALHHEVVEYRKPARLWPEINSLFAMLKVTGGPNGNVSWEKLTYSRYDEGYDFEQEQEARIVTTEDRRDISFSPHDVLALVAPSKQIGSKIISSIEASWKSRPQLVEFPA